MLRRSFLSMLGLGPLAATLGSSSPPIGHSLSAIPHPDVKQWSIPANPIPLDMNAHIKYLREELAGLDDKEKYIAEYMNSTKHDMGYMRASEVDADIAALKSFSDVAKVRLHMRRKAEVRWEQRRNGMIQHIADLLKGPKNDRTHS